MTLLQDDGGDVSLFANKPRQLYVDDTYLSSMLGRLSAHEAAGNIALSQT
jgi:hypothetical protein